MNANVERKIVIVCRPTRLEGLKRRFGTAGQIKFLMRSVAEREGQRGGNAPALLSRAAQQFSDYEREEETYHASISQLQNELGELAPVQVLDRERLPTYLFGPYDIVVTVGQDGLVANAAKYAIGLPIIGSNPDPARFDGVLLPFAIPDVRAAVVAALKNKAVIRNVTLAEVLLSDGQKLLAFNDFYIGAKTHVSARYTLKYGNTSEPQSSSGVLVSTGAGSTGWLSSVLNMTHGLAKFLQMNDATKKDFKLRWEDRQLVFVVREPFISRTSSANLVGGVISEGTQLIVESAMPSGGVIFSDGVESDFLEFSSGAIASIGAAKAQATLVVPQTSH